MRRIPEAEDLKRLGNAESYLAAAIGLVAKAGAVKTLKRLRAARSSLKGALRHAENWEARAERLAK